MLKQPTYMHPVTLVRYFVLLQGVYYVNTNLIVFLVYLFGNLPVYILKNTRSPV